MSINKNAARNNINTAGSRTVRKAIAYLKSAVDNTPPSRNAVIAFSALAAVALASVAVARKMKNSTAVSKKKIKTTVKPLYELHRQTKFH